MPSALYSYWVAVKGFSPSRELVLTWNVNVIVTSSLFHVFLAVLLLMIFKRIINQSELDHCTFP